MRLSYLTVVVAAAATLLPSVGSSKQLPGPATGANYCYRTTATYVVTGGGYAPFTAGWGIAGRDVGECFALMTPAEANFHSQYHPPTYQVTLKSKDVCRNICGPIRKTDPVSNR